MQSSTTSNRTVNQRNAKGGNRSDASSARQSPREPESHLSSSQCHTENVAAGEEECPPPPSPIVHPFVVLTAKSKPGERIMKISMPDERYKMVCGTVTTVGSTIVLGSYPESSTTWCAVHDPARATAHVILKVVALYDENNMYETTVKRIQYKNVVAAAAATADEGLNPSATGSSEPNPRGLLEHRVSSVNGGRNCILTCPVPAKYHLCGGGFYSPMPVVSSLPVPVAAYSKALATKRESDAYGGGGWSVCAPMDDRLVTFGVGLRVRKSAGVSTDITVSLEHGMWRAQLPSPQNTVVVHLGGSNTQDPAAAALFLAPSEASKIAIYRAPPNVWSQYRTPYRSIQDKEKDMQYTRATVQI